MPFTKVSRSNSDPGSQHITFTRPRFNSQVTADRLRESSRVPTLPMVSNIRKGRRSIFKEVGLVGEEAEDQHVTSKATQESGRHERTQFASATGSPSEAQASHGGDSSSGKSKWYSKLAPTKRQKVKTAASAPPPTAVEPKALHDRSTYCNYNDFVALDLTKSWDISSPALEAVSLGYFWNDSDCLYLYGGEISDDPLEQPSPVSMWMYDIASSTWTVFQNPRTWAGNFLDREDVPVQRAAEGAGISVPELNIRIHYPADDYLEKSILAGSFGYKGSGIVQSIIGGSSDGGATATQPGSTATVANKPGGSKTGHDNPAPDTNADLIAVGVIAGLADLAALYLGFRARLYSHRVAACKRHMTIANRYSGAGEEEHRGGSFFGALAAGSLEREKLRKHRCRDSSSSSGEKFGWVGQHLDEPKWEITTATSRAPARYRGQGVHRGRSRIAAPGRTTTTSGALRPSVALRAERAAVRRVAVQARRFWTAASRIS
ncbi:hypothetical protein AAE478_002104 [Parahypoxylon ruwenzoriense]